MICAPDRDRLDSFDHPIITLVCHHSITDAHDDEIDIARVDRSIKCHLVLGDIYAVCSRHPFPPYSFVYSIFLSPFRKTRPGRTPPFYGVQTLTWLDNYNKVYPNNQSKIKCDFPNDKSIVNAGWGNSLLTSRERYLLINIGDTYVGCGEIFSEFAILTSHRKGIRFTND